MRMERSGGRMRATALGLLLIAALPGANAAETGFYVAATAGPTEGQAKKSGDFPYPITPFEFATAVSDGVGTDDGELGWSVVLGYRINRYLAGELAFHRFGLVTNHETFHLEPPPATGPTILDFGFYSNRVEGPSVSLLGKVPIGDRTEIFFRAGVLFADVTVDGPTLIPTLTLGDDVWIAGVGADWHFAERLAYRF
jgi:Outer membrane protein beta-barrel domain